VLYRVILKKIVEVKIKEEEELCEKVYVLKGDMGVLGVGRNVEEVYEEGVVVGEGGVYKLGDEKCRVCFVRKAVR
uniref:hypothetical protein n=1 Tax=Bacillus thuringiensis TaxID=1428 RepID=UPI00164273CA